MNKSIFGLFLSIFLFPLQVYGGWDQYDDATINCTVIFLKYNGVKDITKQRLLSITEENKQYKQLLEVVEYCKKATKVPVQENIPCKGRSKKTGKEIRGLCSIGWYTKVNGKNQLISMEESIKLLSEQGTGAAKYGQFAVTSSEKLQAEVQEKLKIAKNIDAENTKQSVVSKSDSKTSKSESNVEKISKSDFIKKYYGKKKFNQELEFKNIIGHFFVSKKNKKTVYIMYMGQKYLFLFKIEKSQFKDFYGAHSDKRHKLVKIHQPHIFAHEIKEGVLSYYKIADKSKSENYNTYGIYKGKSLNKTRLIFKKGKFVHIFDNENSEYLKWESVGSSFDELNKKESYKFVQKIYQGVSKSGEYPVAVNTSLTEIFRSEYDVASFLLSSLKEKGKLKANKQDFGSYSKRDKTLAEQVLNYTTSGKPEGKGDNYWYAVKGDKCTLQPVGSARWLNNKKTPFNVKKINQTAFKIYPETIMASRALFGDMASAFNRVVFKVESEKKVYFVPLQSLVDLDRLYKAWSLLFDECPGKKSKF